MDNCFSKSNTYPTVGCNNMYYNLSILQNQLFSMADVCIVYNSWLNICMLSEASLWPLGNWCQSYTLACNKVCSPYCAFNLQRICDGMTLFFIMNLMMQHCSSLGVTRLDAILLVLVCRKGAHGPPIRQRLQYWHHMSIKEFFFLVATSSGKR
jgi:hypothetical protein